MSVLTCNRRGCGNIMCDRYSYTYGHICNECFQELAENESINIEEFMNCCKEESHLGTKRRNWLNELNNIFEDTTF